MRRLLIFTALLFASASIFAQLTIKPSANDQKSSYLYVKNDVVFVSNDLKLFKNPVMGSEASIYLRAGAQLLQGESQNKPNSGTGSISVFAEGNTNGFDYNYWSSPIISPENDLFGVSLLYAPFSEIKSNKAQLTTALNGIANPLTISSRWIYTFHGSSYSNWNFVGANTAIPPGYGFTMKGTDGMDATEVEGRPNNPGNSQRYDFRGKPVSGNIEISVTKDMYVLVGNPYPSTLDLSLFLLENSGSGSLNTYCNGNIERRNITTGIAYFWDSKENGSSHYVEDYMGGYGAFSPVDPCTGGVYEAPVFRKINGVENGGKGKAIYGSYLPIGQGFMVKGAESGKVLFKNTHRKLPQETIGSLNNLTSKAQVKYSHNSENEKLSKVQLKISVSDQYERTLSMAFWAEATAGTDKGMDAEAFELAPTDVGWLHGEQSMVIDVRPFDISEEIPLFLKVDPNHPKVTFSEGIFENSLVKELFIVDTQSLEYFSITKEPLTLELEPGTYHSRFKLAFAKKVPEEKLPQEFFTEEEVVENFDIFQNNRQGELQIISNAHFPVKAVGIFDLQGKRMLCRSNFDNPRSIEISTRPWANGVYIVKVTGMDNKKTMKKISVYNN